MSDTKFFGVATGWHPELQEAYKFDTLQNAINFCDFLSANRTIQHKNKKLFIEGLRLGSWKILSIPRSKYILKYTIENLNKNRREDNERIQIDSFDRYFFIGESGWYTGDPTFFESFQEAIECCDYYAQLKNSYGDQIANTSLWKINTFLVSIFKPSVWPPNSLAPY